MIVTFTELHGVGDDAELRDVGTGACRRRDHQHRRDGTGDPVDAGVVEDVPAVARQDGDALGRVHARPAAQGDEHVAPGFEVAQVPVGYLVVLRDSG